MNGAHTIPFDSELGGEIDGEMGTHNYPTPTGTKSRISSLAGCPVAPKPVGQTILKAKTVTEEPSEETIKKAYEDAPPN